MKFICATWDRGGGVGPTYQPPPLRHRLGSQNALLGRTLVRRMRLILKIVLIGHARPNLTSKAVEDATGHLVLIQPAGTFPLVREARWGTVRGKSSHLIG